MQFLKSGILFSVCLVASHFIALSSALTGNGEVNFTQCLINFQNGSYGLTGGVDRNGIPITSLNQPEGLRYPQCITVCGDGWQRSDLADISLKLTAWLFPWLVLVARLPFQPEGKGHDIFSAFLVIGSPIIAMHSLLVTLSNSRWILYTL